MTIVDEIATCYFSSHLFFSASSFSFQSSKKLITVLGAILSAISTILLVSLTAVACIVIKREHINLVFELERYLEQKDHQGLAKLVRVINKSFTSPKLNKHNLT